MSDFDFDEIDKAVTDALATNDNYENQSTTSDTPDNSSVSQEQIHTEDKSKSIQASMPAAHRGSGRFMDVIHPSSDMRSRQAFTPPKIVKEIHEDDKPEEISSPFLPDAKVEKRPLGITPNDQNDVLHSAPQPLLISNESEEEPLLIEAPDELLLEATYEETDAPSPSVNASNNEAVPTSITQQYVEQPSSTQPSSPIYDTESYHQALPQTKKHHSSVWIVLWIILLIIVGAGAGIAIYLFVLPLLSI